MHALAALLITWVQLRTTVVLLQEQQKRVRVHCSTLVRRSLIPAVLHVNSYLIFSEDDTHLSVSFSE